MSSFQVKIVGDFCNLRCTYCRNRDFDQNSKCIMSYETLENLFRLYSNLRQNKIRTNWHGGEPLLAGKDFFRRIMELEKQYHEKLWVNGLQTNATQIDKWWASFLKDNNFQVGVSVDGDEETHNINRVNAAEQGTYKKTMRGVEILRQHGIEPGVICTVTKQTVGYGRKMLLGLVERGFKNIAFNAFYNTASDFTADSFGINNTEWYSFLVETFETWLALNNPQIRIRELDGVLAWTRFKVINSCVYKGTCDQWFVIYQDGGIHPCERLGRKICFGNINTKTNMNSKFEQISAERTRNPSLIPTKCESCKLYRLCHNGCVAHRRTEEGGTSLFAYCESRLNFHDYVLNRLARKEVV